MKLVPLKYFIFCLPFIWAKPGYSQIRDCKLTLVKLQMDSIFNALETPDNFDSNTIRHADSVLLEDSDIINVQVQVDSGCCWYGGMIYNTKYVFTITQEAAIRLRTIPIPLSSGIPVSLRIDDVEIFRASLWNKLSSFANDSITIMQFDNILRVTNRLPAIGDHVASRLRETTTKFQCLLEKKRIAANKGFLDMAR